MASAGAMMAIGTGAKAGASIAGGFLQRGEARRQARRVEKAGELEAERMRNEAAQVLSAQRVAFAGSGVDPSSPTALDVAAQAARIGELNALRRQFEFQEEARAIREAGSRAVMLGISEGIGTVLEGGYKMREYGVGSKQKTKVR